MTRDGRGQRRRGTEEDWQKPNPIEATRLGTWVALPRVSPTARERKNEVRLLAVGLSPIERGTEMENIWLPILCGIGFTVGTILINVGITLRLIRS